MAILNEPQRQVLGGWVWPFLTAAAGEGMTASAVQQGIAGLAEENDINLTFQDYTAIATLYGYARRMENAAQEFRAADINAALTPDLVGVPPWARDITEQNASGKWHGIFEFTFIDQAGNQVTEMRTSIWDVTRPSTVGGIIDDMQADAEAMAAKYEVQLVGISPVQLLAV